LTDESTLVLCHPDRLQTLLLNLFLKAQERMAGLGRIRISTSQVDEGQVLILFEIEHIGISAWGRPAFPPEMESSDFSLSIAQAIVSAMEGSLVFTALSDTQGRLEIRLPLQHSARDFAGAPNRRGTVLVIGSDLYALGKIEERLEAAQYSVIRCSSVAEALLLGQLYDGTIDCVIAGADGVSTPNRRKLHAFFSSRNSETKFIRLTTQQQAGEQTWQSFPGSPESSAAERLVSLLGRDDPKAKPR
jgi:hypothetical protein